MKAFHRLHELRMKNDETRFRMDEMAPRFDKLREHPTPRIVTAFQLFQTPQAVAERMVALAEPRPGLDWLEPSAGLGRILRPILETAPGNVTACEASPDVAGELFADFPGVKLAQRDFLSIAHPREGTTGLIIRDMPGPAFFDRVVMNPPFHMRADIRHTLHALGFLKRGGILVGLCLAGDRRERELKPLCDLWETLPAGTFSKEGTNVETNLFRIRKNEL